jgi:hypothetical protein
MYNSYDKSDRKPSPKHGHLKTASREAEDGGGHARNLLRVGSSA